MNMPKVLLVGLIAGMTAAAATPVTFNKDVLPVLQKNCQVCHRPGEMAPMSFLNYSDARPWAKAIKEAVADEENAAMVRRDRSLRERTELEPGRDRHMAAWADNGAWRAMPKTGPRRLRLMMDGTSSRHDRRNAERFPCAGDRHHQLPEHQSKS